MSQMAAAAAATEADLDIDFDKRCSTCGDAWETAGSELRLCGVCLDVGLCSARCAALHFRTRPCINGGKKPDVVARRATWKATMHRWGVSMLETPFDKAEKTKLERKQRAAAAAAATAASGDKRKAVDDDDASEPTAKKAKKTATGAWPKCTSADAPCVPPVSCTEEEKLNYFVRCADEDCPSRRKAERRAFDVLVARESTRFTLDLCRGAESDMDGTERWDEFGKVLNSVGLRCDQTRDE